MRSNILTRPFDQDNDNYARFTAAILSHPEITSLSTKEVIEFMYAFYTNEMDMLVPALRTIRTLRPDMQDCIDCGYSLDPFASLINHSCAPNTMSNFEGKQPRFRAERDISAGEELTGIYTFKLDGVKRKEKLLKCWGFECSCQICEGKDIPKPLEASLLNHATDLVHEDDPQKLLAITLDPFGYHKSCKLALNDILESGASWGVFPMADLHLLVYSGYCRGLDRPNMLKTWLRFVYLVEPASRPRHPKDQCITHLKLLINPLNTSSAHDEYLPYPASVAKLTTNLWYHLRYKVLRDVQKCFGEDSEIARFQYRENEDVFGRNESLSRDSIAIQKRFRDKLGCDFIPISPTAEGRKAKEKFLRDMNELLAWAEVPPMTERELL